MFINLKKSSWITKSCGLLILAVFKDRFGSLRNKITELPPVNWTCEHSSEIYINLKYCRFCTKHNFQHWLMHWIQYLLSLIWPFRKKTVQVFCIIQSEFMFLLISVQGFPFFWPPGQLYAWYNCLSSFFCLTYTINGQLVSNGFILELSMCQILFKIGELCA